MANYLMGVDLACQDDYTAVVLAERLALPSVDVLLALGRRCYNIRHIERFRHVGYPQIVGRIRELTTSKELAGQTRVVVDATGVGLAVVQMLKGAHLGAPITAVTITAGMTTTRDERGTYSVPKKDLIGSLRILLDSGRLKIARSLPLADVLTSEMELFRTKTNVVTGYERLEAWRERDHDDVVLAASLACWFGEHGSQPFDFVKLPEGPSQTITWEDGTTTKIVRG